MSNNPARVLLILVTSFLFVLPVPGQGAEISQGAMLANSCAGCHGTDGNSPGAIPSLKGKSVDFFVTTMKDFASGKRPSTVMGRHAKGYSDEEIKLIAEFFGK